VEVEVEEYDEGKEEEEEGNQGVVNEWVSV